MKDLWIRADGSAPWDARKKKLTNALELGVNSIWVNKEDIEKVRKLGKIGVVSESPDADLIVGKNIAYTVISDKKTEEKVVKDGKTHDYVVFKAMDWKVIPLENIIAGLQKEKAKIIVEVSTYEEAKTVLETLEVGADGVLVDASEKVVKKIRDYVESLSNEKLNLVVAEVKEVKSVGMGDRVCIDTCSMFNLGEGMLVGSQSNGLFLVHSETLESEYVAARPFRVNAGPVHAYTMVPGGKTRYMSELNAGDEVLGVDSEGNTRSMIVGRSKIEKRPLILVEAIAGEKKIKSLLQNAETINLVTSDKKPVSVVKLKKGDKILAYTEEGGRHFGMKVKESINEK
jgi:3-dehydroquinate synthase II